MSTRLERIESSVNKIAEDVSQLKVDVATIQTRDETLRAVAEAAKVTRRWKIGQVLAIAAATLVTAANIFKIHIP